MDFTSEVDIEIENVDTKGKLRWSAELECREWGIKAVDVCIPDQDIACVLDEKDAIVPIRSGLKIEYEGGTEHGAELWPVKVEVWRGKTTVYFHKGA